MAGEFLLGLNEVRDRRELQRFRLHHGDGDGTAPSEEG
jgi:hypothetical protein